MNAEKIIEGNVKMDKMMIEAPRVGKIEYDEEDIIVMTTPMLGFANLNDFLLISTEQTYPFYWLQSIEDPEISFLMVETGLFFKDYLPKFNRRDFKILQAEELGSLRIFAIVVVPSNPKDATANLRAPIVFNEEKKLAKQIILDEDKYSIKTRVFER